MDRVNFISNTKVLGSVFQNSQARDARQKKHGKKGSMQRRQSMVTVVNNIRGNGRDSAESSWTEQLVEVSVFLFLIVPSMVLSFFAVKQGSLSFVLVAFATILRDLALVSLILFFVWRNSEPINWIGWTFRKARKEIALGIGLYIPFFIAAGFLERALQVAGFSVPSTPLPSMAAKGMGELLLAIALVAVVALGEETIFRGYLILRLKAITVSPAAAALLSAAIFSLGHGYEGSAGVVTVGVMGVIFALIYMWRQSLVAPIVMHFLQDFIGIVLLPLFGKG
jgi:membrane protease YdiL (CAAX protease family)